MDKPLHRLNQKKPHIVTLIIMSSFASMGAVIFTPALPEIADYFHITDNLSQLTITLFLVGYALGQLIYGPLSNRFGRKKAFYIGIGISTIGSIVSILSEPLNSFTALILGRMLEALGSSAGLVISFTIVNDYYFPDSARKVISYMTLAFAIIPGIATFIGGLLVTHFHWISCFYFLLLYGLLLAFPVHRVAETARVLNAKALHFANLRKNYVCGFKNKLLRNTALYFSLSTLCIYAFTASAPLLAIHRLGISAQAYGFVGLIPFIGTALGSMTSARLSSKCSARALMKAGYLVEVVTALVFSALFFSGYVNLVVLMGSGFFFMFGACIILSNGTSLAGSQYEDKATASAVMQFINVSMPVLGTLLLALTPGHNVMKLPGIWLIALILMFVVSRFNKE